MKEWGLARRERRRRLMCLGNVGSHGKRQRFPGLLSSGPSRGLPLLYPVLLCDFSLTLRIHYYTHTHTHTHFFCLTSLMEFIPCNKSFAARDLSTHCPLGICPPWHGLALSRVLGCRRITCIPGPEDDLRFIHIPQSKCGKGPPLLLQSLLLF